MDTFSIPFWLPTCVHFVKVHYTAEYYVGENIFYHSKFIVLCVILIYNFSKLSFLKIALQVNLYKSTL